MQISRPKSPFHKTNVTVYAITIIQFAKCKLVVIVINKYVYIIFYRF